jgi:hypothetical protein
MNLIRLPWVMVLAFSVSIAGLASIASAATNIIAGPGEQGLRNAIQAAQDGDTVTLSGPVSFYRLVARRHF